MSEPAVPPRTARSGRAEAAFAAVCGLIVALYAAIAAPSRSDWGNIEPAHAYYNLLAEGLAAGQLHLAVEVPAGLLALRDPYDPAASFPYRVRYNLHDTSFFQGKIYLYNGITPALVLYGPYHWLTGGYLANKQAAWAFAALGFLAGAAILHTCWRRYFPGLAAGAPIAGLLTLAAAGAIPQLLLIPGTAECTIACAGAFAMLACWGVLRALPRGPRWQGWLVFASACYGLAVGARPSVLFGAVVLLAPMVSWRRAPLSRRAWAQAAVATLGPILLIGAGLAAYNFARFGSIFEFGQRYQLAGDRQDTARHFSLGYVGFNLRMYFLQPPTWSAVFPWVRAAAVPPVPAGHAAAESAQGMLTHAPILLAAAALLARRIRHRVAAELQHWAVAVALVFAAHAAVLSLFYGTVLRYQAEFQPFLALLAGVGVLALEAGWPRWPARLAWLAALGVTLPITTLTGVKMLAEEFNRQSHRLLAAGQPQAAIARLEDALRLLPDSVAAHGNLANVLFAQGDFAGAAEHFAAAARLAPELYAAHEGLARSLAASGRAAEAVAAFRTALGLLGHEPQLAEQRAVLHANLATLLFRLGDASAARTHYEEAQTAGRNQPGARAALDLARQTGVAAGELSP